MVRTRLARFFAAAACVISAFASPAHAQCGGWVHDLESYGPEFLRSFAPRVIDRDGRDGAQIPRIVGLGIDRLVTKSDEDWSFLSERLTGGPYPLEAWDADGPGPMTPRLYFGRASLASGNDQYLDSVPWPKTGAVGSHALAPVPGRVYDMRLTDPDGPGPARPRPIVVCAGSESGNTVIVLEWDGTAWIQRGSTLVGNSARIIVSPSASGGGDEWTIYGNFHRPGPPFVNIIARFDGSNWAPLGDGLQGGGVESATLWDHDGDPSTARKIVVSGPFIESGTTRLNYVAMFDGTKWVSIGDGLTNPTRGVATYVHVTTRREELLVTTSGDDESDPGFAAFDGMTWRNVDPVGNFDIERTSLQTWDPDGPLSDPPGALVLITKGYSDPPVHPGLYTWNGEVWHPVVQTFDAFSPVQGWWDPDGDGPKRPLLAVVAPYGRTSRGTLQISTWDGVKWSTADTGIVATGFPGGHVSCMTSWDPDGDGPESPMLVLGGRFNVSLAGEPDIINIAGWNGGSLVRLGEGLRGSGVVVDDLHSWDADGDGPEVPRLFAYGSISGSGVDSFKSVAQFDGESWLPLGDGVWPEHPSSSDCVYAMGAWDADLDGPLESILLVGGKFALSESGPLIPLAAWDGVSLQPFAESPLPSDLRTVRQIASVRDARSGIEEPALLIGHSVVADCFDHPDHDHAGCSYDFTTWILEDKAWAPFQSYGSWFETWDPDYFEGGATPPNVITLHDPDGPGPRREHLVYGHSNSYGVEFNVGSYGFPDATTFVGGPVAYSDYGEWDFYDETAMTSVLSIPVLSDLAITSYAGYFFELVVSDNYFDTANPSRPIDGIARWMEGPPHILEVPEPRTNPETRAFGLTVHAIGGGDLGYQWTRNGEILKAGPTPRGSIVHSPAGPTLIISNASHLDQGEYRCRVINACGSTLGPILTMPFIYCAADVNFDEIVDILDLLDFLQAYGECEGLPMPCGSTTNPDFNGDTLIDVVDFLDFFDRFGQGC